MRNLYAFTCDCGRMGTLEGRFLATDKEAKALIGETIMFGEVLGKNSEIEVDIEEKHIALVTDNQEFLQKAEELGINLESGLSPLAHCVCHECGEPKDLTTGLCTSCCPGCNTGILQGDKPCSGCGYSRS